MRRLRHFILIIMILSACDLGQNRGTSTPATNPSVTASQTTVPPTTTDTPSPTTTTVLDTPTPAVVATLAPTCRNAPRTRLIVQERGRVTMNDETLNLRDGPGTENYTILEQIEPGAVFFILDGPTCAENYVWYRVRYGTLTGWIAEGDFTEYYAEPYPPG